MKFYMYTKIRAFKFADLRCIFGVKFSFFISVPNNNYYCITSKLHILFSLQIIIGNFVERIKRTQS